MTRKKLLTGALIWPSCWVETCYQLKMIYLGNSSCSSFCSLDGELPMAWRNMWLYLSFIRADWAWACSTIISHHWDVLWGSEGWERKDRTQAETQRLKRTAFILLGGRERERDENPPERERGSRAQWDRKAWWVHFGDSHNNDFRDICPVLSLGSTCRVMSNSPWLPAGRHEEPKHL